MNIKEKETIKELTAAKIELVGSQNKYAQAHGVSSATITNLMKGNWSKIGEDMWRKLADACGFTTSDWKIVQITPFKDLFNFYNHAQQESTTFGLVAPAGGGKSATAQWYQDTNQNVYVLSCAEYWNKKIFLSELLKSMGSYYRGKNVYELMESVEEEILKKSSPLIILDEVDKLKDDVLYFFITLYNRLNGKCGIVLQSTDYIKKRMERGLRLNRKGFSEIFSRIGSKWVNIQEANSHDISGVCIANGVTDTNFIHKVAQESNGDLRRVERMVSAHNKKRKEVAHV